jgi:hypothetical protein
MISFPLCFWYFAGNCIAIPLIAFFLIICIEQPLLKLMHYTLWPYISHDYMLINFEDIKHGMASERSQSLDANPRMTDIAPKSDVKAAPNLMQMFQKSLADVKAKEGGVQK